MSQFLLFFHFLKLEGAPRPFLIISIYFINMILFCIFIFLLKSTSLRPSFCDSLVVRNWDSAWDGASSESGSSDSNNLLRDSRLALDSLNFRILCLSNSSSISNVSNSGRKDFRRVQKLTDSAFVF